MLSTGLQNLERLVAPSGSSSIYFSSNKVDFSIFPDLITSISNVIWNWRLTDAERTKILAEAEKLHYKNEGTKLVIIYGQIDYVSEKLYLGETKDVEQIQKFLLLLISYIENNPVGMINGVSYDISKEVYLLKDQPKHGKRLIGSFQT